MVELVCAKGRCAVIPSECKCVFRFTKGWLVKVYELFALHVTQMWRARSVFVSVALLLEPKVQECP